MHYFFLLSGEHSELPKAEVEAILESEKIPIGRKTALDQVVLVETTSEGMWCVAKRAAMVHGGGLHLITARIDQSDWKTQIDVLLDTIEIPLRAGSSFAVRVRRIKRSSPHIKIPALERWIGACLLKKLGPNIHVDLKHPDNIIYGLLTRGYLILGVRIFLIKRSNFDMRRAHFRRFMHPSAINPRFARLMVNLSRVSPQKIFLDPFAGSGGMLIEAGLIGCQSLGIEIDPAMIQGAHANLQGFNIGDYELIVGDARFPPLKAVDAIATDPPYGASSSTKGADVPQLVSDALTATRDILAPGGYICIATPHTIDLKDLGTNAGLQLHSLFRQFVHKSLTRQIGVFKR